MSALTTTYTGQEIDILNFKKEDINLYDIAVSLSRQRRYAGHTALPWTVGQHAILCAMMVEAVGMDELSRKLVFLHDHEEYVVQDVVFPIKHNFMLRRYKTVSNHVSDVIYDFFGLGDEWAKPENKKFVSIVDQAAYVIEALQLKPGFIYEPEKFSKEINEFLSMIHDDCFSIPMSLIRMSDQDVATAIFEISNVIHAESVLGGEVDYSAERLAELQKQMELTTQ